VKKTSWAVIAMVLVAAAWGAAFVLMKPAIDKQPVFDFLATRFTIATLAMIVAKPSILRRINKQVLVRGIPLGTLLGLGYVTQTIGLGASTAAITGFITGLYVVLTPILGWLIFKSKVTPIVLWGVAVATIGLAFISIHGGSIGVGEIWVIACAFFFAAHIVGLGKFSPKQDIYALTVVQLGVVAVINWIGALPDGYISPPDASVWFAILFTAIFATAVAFFVQTYVQSIMDASRVAIILTLEVVFAAGMAVGIGQEVLTLQTIFGGALMIGSMLLIEWPRKSADGPKEPGYEPIYEPLAH
jgi:drug/metabolite transporter (DMT)-like permease